MALPDNVIYTQGTPVIWGESGGSGVTNVISLDALASGSARMGASVDLGANIASFYRVELRVETGTAPTIGGTVDLYLPCSYDGSSWPGGVTGSDGAWPSDGNEDEWAAQLASAFVGSLVATNDGNVVQTQSAWLWRPLGRYVVPVVDNNLDQAFRDQVTASNNLSRVILLPFNVQIID